SIRHRRRDGNEKGRPFERIGVCFASRRIRVATLLGTGWLSRSQEGKVRHYVSLSEPGPQYHDKAIAPGAQTERRGVAGPVRVLLGGEPSPAAIATRFSPPVSLADSPDSAGVTAHHQRAGGHASGVDVVVTGGGVVVRDDGRGIVGERPQVVDAAAYARA